MLTLLTAPLFVYYHVVGQCTVAYVRPEITIVVCGSTTYYHVVRHPLAG